MENNKTTYSFTRKIIFATSITLCVIYFITAVYIKNRSYSQVLKEAEQKSENTIEMMAAKMDITFQLFEQKAIFIANTMTTNLFDTLRSEQNISEMLMHDSSLLSCFIYLKEKTENFNYSIFLQKENNHIQSRNIEDKMGENIIKNMMEQTRTSNDIHWKTPHFSEITQQIESCVWCPIFSNQQVVGIVGCNVLLNDVFDINKNYETEPSFFFVAAEDGTILTPCNHLFSTGFNMYETAKENNDLQWMNISKLMMNGEKDDMILILLEDDKEWYFSCIPLHNQHVSLGMMMDKKTILSDMKTMNKNLIFLLLFSIISTVAMLYFLINKRMKFLKELSKATKLIGKGTLNTPFPDAETNDEFLTLRNNLQYMKENLMNYTTKLVSINRQEEQIQQEIIQYQYFKKHILPIDYRKFVLNNSKLLEFKIEYHPAKKISGDFYDYFFLNENKFCLLLGNIEGKDATLPLFISYIISNLQNNLHEKINLSKYIEKFNNFLYQHNEKGWTIKMLIAIIDSKTKTLNFVNIGYELLYIIRNQIIANVDTMHGLAIGVVEDAQFSSSTIDLQNNDTIISCSNIVPHLLNKQGVNFSREKIEHLLSNFKSENPIDLLHNISNEIENHLQTVERKEDYTLLAMKVFNE